MSDFTNFHSYSHGDLRKMVQAMDSGGVMAASDPWRRAAQTLKDIHVALNSASLEATSSWEGSTSQAFLSKMSKLANSVNNAAAYANDAAVSMQMMSEAIDTAKRDMPEEPGFWEQVGDGAQGFAESTVGIDNATTETSLADRRKAQAVGVMETLAIKYRATTANLKPPTKTWFEEDSHSISDGSSVAEAISALIVGGGMGVVGGNPAPGESTSAHGTPASARRVTPQSPREAVRSGPTDAGINGGIANSVSPKSPVAAGPGTGIDDIQGGTSGTVIRGGSPALGQGDVGAASGSRTVGGVLGGKEFGFAVGSDSRGGADRTLSGGTGLGRAGSSVGGRAATGSGAGGMDRTESEATGRAGGSAARRSGGVVGERGGGGAGKTAFTEGGSGIGRGRGGSQGAAGQGHGTLGGAHGGHEGKKQGKRRPDYLVEDPDTWMSGDKANPDVVE